ncbi:MAG TPA: AgmX/PglI C-terminal domain-containing protein [Moraxellaceae bacterium]|nr:AgmX/PglI C-terminal domain-containing protein [Moraxellaceae bacterium]
MSNLVLDNLSPTLPWDPLPGESNRLRGLLAIFLILAFLIMLIVPHVELPKVDRAKAEAVPESLAKVVLERKEVPPPPPPPVEKVKKEEVKKEETTAKKEEAAPKPVEEAAPKPVVTDLQRSAARARASQAIQEAGIADALKDLRDMDVGAAATPHGMPGQTGNGTGGLITSTEEAGTSRNLITSKAGAGSGSGAGAYSGGMSSGYGGGKAGGKGTAGLLGAGGAGGAGGKLQSVQSNVASAAAAQSASRVGKDGKSHRTTEDIRKVLDRYGARLNNLYQRALRDDPTMQGAVVLKLSVAPDGSVTAASVQSSQLNNADLESKIVALVRGFNFGAMDVEPWSGPIDVNFLPQ